MPWASLLRASSRRSVILPCFHLLTVCTLAVQHVLLVFGEVRQDSFGGSTHIEGKNLG